MDKVYNLFPIPFLKSYLDVSYEIIDFANNLDYERLETQYITHQKYILDLPNMLPFRSFITEKVYEYFYNVCGFSKEVVPIITTSWINLHHQGDSNDTHIHYNSIVSGVWYLSTEEGTGDFMFMRDNKELFGNTFSFPSNTPNNYNSGYSAFSPKTGDLFIFPSCLKHRVDPNKEQFNRLSLAFNCLVKGSVESEGVSVDI